MVTTRSTTELALRLAINYWSSVPQLGSEPPINYLCKIHKSNCKSCPLYSAHPDHLCLTIQPTAWYEHRVSYHKDTYSYCVWCTNHTKLALEMLTRALRISIAKSKAKAKTKTTSTESPFQLDCSTCDMRNYTDGLKTYCTLCKDIQAKLQRSVL